MNAYKTIVTMFLVVLFFSGCDSKRQDMNTQNTTKKICPNSKYVQFTDISKGRYSAHKLLVDVKKGQKLSSNMFGPYPAIFGSSTATKNEAETPIKTNIILNEQIKCYIGKKFKSSQPKYSLLTKDMFESEPTEEQK